MFRSNLRWNLKFLIRSFNKAADYFPKYIQNDLPETKVSKLSNDVKVISENWETETCTVGLWIDIGSRCENDTNNGVAHFLEHMYFKGTKNRTHDDVQLQTIERGAKLNAYTTREMIAIYANCHKRDLEWAISLLGEIVSTPKFDESLVEKTREYILNELKETERNYRDVVFDYLHATAYQGTPLSRSVLGNEETVKNLTSKDLYDFIGRFYKAPKMNLVAIGDIDHDNLKVTAEKFLGNVSCNYEGGIDQRLLCRFTGSDIRDRDDALPLGHVAIAFEGPGCAHGDIIPLIVASSIYGSYDHTFGGTYYTSNHLAVASFKNGNIHSFHNFFIPYHDTSLWGFYYTCTGKGMQLVTESIIQRIIRLCANISEFEVNRAKNQLKSSMMSYHSGTNMVCDKVGKQMVKYGRKIPLEEIISRIDMVNANDIREVCMKYIYDKCPAVAGYGPIEGLTDYNNIRSRTWWLRL